MPDLSRLVTRRVSEREFVDAFVVGTKKGLTAWGDLVAKRASERAPVDTTQLAQSIHATDVFVVGKFAWGISVGSDLEYAAAQEFGSGLHSPDPNKRHKYLIEAGFWTGKSSKKSLAFLWPGGPGEDVGSAYDAETGMYFFRSIKHPGVRAQPYLRPALKDTEQDGRTLLWSAIAAELNKAGHVPR